MVKKYHNLFPKDLTKAAKTVYDAEAMQPVLLKLQPADSADFDHHQLNSPPAELLNRGEIANLKRYKLPKRRSEYLTGRICAKIAISNYLSETETTISPINMTGLEINAAKDGRPVVHIYQSVPQPEIDISITHSGGYGAALATGSICGIDLQKQDESLFKVKERYCTEFEGNLLNDILPEEKILTRLSLLWAAKEAAKKALGYWWMPGFLDLEAATLKKKFTNCMSLSLRLKRSGDHQTPSKVTVVTGKFGNYGLAICLINRDRNSA